MAPKKHASGKEKIKKSKLRVASDMSEKVFSILSVSLNDQQESALSDYSQASLMLQYNKRLSISELIIWLCLTRTGNYQIHESDWLKWILTAV